MIDFRNTQVIDVGFYEVRVEYIFRSRFVIRLEIGSLAYFFGHFYCGNVVNFRSRYSIMDYNRRLKSYSLGNLLIFCKLI